MSEEIIAQEQVIQEPQIAPEPQTVQEVGVTTPESTGTDVDDSTQSKPSGPDIGHPRWNEVYWKAKQAERDARVEREKRESLEKEFNEFRNSFTQSQINEIDNRMRIAAEENDLATWHNLNAARERIGTPKQEAPKEKPKLSEGEEYRDLFLSQPENMHLLIDGAKGGTKEVGFKVHDELMNNPVWARAYHEHPAEYWNELTRRVAEKKKPTPSQGTVEGVQTSQTKAPSKMLTLEQIAEREGGTVDEIKKIAEHMYPNEQTPQARYAKYIKNYMEWGV